MLRHGKPKRALSLQRVNEGSKSTSSAQNRPITKERGTERGETARTLGGKCGRNVNRCNFVQREGSQTTTRTGIQDLSRASKSLSRSRAPQPTIRTSSGNKEKIGPCAVQAKKRERKSTEQVQGAGRTVPHRRKVNRRERQEKRNPFPLPSKQKREKTQKNDCVWCLLEHGRKKCHFPFEKGRHNTRTAKASKGKRKETTKKKSRPRQSPQK